MASVSSSRAKGFKAYFEFLGGQNSAAAPDNLNDNEARLLENVDVVVRGALVTRDGTTEAPWTCLAGITDVKIDRTAEFATSTGVVIQLVLAGGNLYKREDATPLLTEAGSHMDYTVYNNKLYLLIKDSYYVYDGLTIAEVDKAGASDNNLPLIKKCKYIQARAERIYCSGNPEAPNALYFSQVGDPSYFKTGSFVVQAASSDGDVITGLTEFNEALLVFKARGVWGWFGYSVLDDVRFMKLNTHAGTKAYRTIRNVNNMLFYLSEDGVYAMRGTYSGQIEVNKVTSSIDDVFKKLYAAPKAHENNAIAIYNAGKYVLSCVVKTADAEQDMTLNNTTVVCHVDAGMSSSTLPWSVYKGVYMRDVLDSVDGKVYFADAAKTEFFVFDENAYTDRGDPIYFKVSTKDYDMGSPIHVKKIKLAWLAVNQDIDDETVFTADVYVDYSKVTLEDITASESLVLGKGEYGDNKWGWIDTVTRMLKVSRKGIRARIEFTGNTATIPNNRLFMYGVAFMYKIKKHYKDKGGEQI